jgi:response regulator NasT
MSKILVVDDDLVVLATVSLGLREAGYHVLQVDSGELAIQVCRREKPDLAILDMRMPGMSGIDVGRVLKKEIGIPFIFLSAFSDKDTIDAAAETGALGYLVKPLEISRIVPAIEMALARAEDMATLEKGHSNLSTALGHNREIDIAVGLAMARHHLNRTDAFEALRTYARSHRCKIAEVAQQIINGEVTLLRC